MNTSKLIIFFCVAALVTLCSAQPIADSTVEPGTSNHLIFKRHLISRCICPSDEVFVHGLCVSCEEYKNLLDTDECPPTCI